MAAGVAIRMTCFQTNESVIFVVFEETVGRF
jgi:hypothetical protein